MKTRRDFIKLFGGMFAAGTTLFAGGKVLAKPEPEELDNKRNTAERILDHKRRIERIQRAQSNAPKENAHGILRLAQAASQWVHEDKVQKGHWFIHMSANIQGSGMVRHNQNSIISNISQTF